MLLNLLTINILKFTKLSFSLILTRRYQSETSSLEALHETSQALSLQMVACEERAAKAEADARIERDWRCSLQEKETKHKELISSLQIEIKKLTDDIRVSIFKYIQMK